MDNIKFTKITYFLSFIISFMFFIYEPIILYTSNMDDFRFNIYDFLKIASLPFLILFLSLLVLNIIIYKLNKKAYLNFNVIVYVIFFVSYIEGNFLSYALPVLNGEYIDWSKYFLNDFISIVLDVSAVILTIKLVKKYSKEVFIKKSFYVSLAIFFMLSASMVASVVASGVLKVNSDGIYVSATSKNINKYSSEDNFIILLLDSVDSSVFNQAMINNPDLAKSLKDFTYYKDTMSMHPYTTESVPLILTGESFQNQDTYKRFYINSYKNSKLLSDLYNNDYEVNIYDHEFVFNDYDALKVANVINDERLKDINGGGNNYMIEIMRYSAFKYLPYTLKYLANIEFLNFDYFSSASEDYSDGNIATYSWENGKFIRNLQNEVTLTEGKNFKFIHLMGSHVPYCVNKEFVFNTKQVFPYSYEVEVSLMIINNYINYLKENNIYDNSKIIIMSDHGANPDSKVVEEIHGRQNPILFIKGKKETHKKMPVSDKKISFVDLADMYQDLIDNKESKDLFPNIGTERKRKYLLYSFSNKKEMVEQETEGSAWETDKLIDTGTVYKRKHV